MRALFGIAAAHWKELEQTDIDDWCKLAHDIPGLNKFNESYYQAGFNLYCQLQHNIQLIGRSIYDPAPTIPTIIELTSLTLDLTHSGPIVISLLFPSQTTSLHTTYLIYATPPLSVGRNYVKTKYRLITTLASGTADMFEFSDFYSHIFPDPDNNQKISCKITPFDNDTGFAGHSLFSSAIWNP